LLSVGEAPSDVKSYYPVPNPRDIGVCGCLRWRLPARAGGTESDRRQNGTKKGQEFRNHPDWDYCIASCQPTLPPEGWHLPRMLGWDMHSAALDLVTLPACDERPTFTCGSFP
jgi:hypothetical protein